MRRTFLLTLLLAWASLVSASSDLDLDQYSGKVVVIDFWASWCVPCRRSFPWMNEMHSRYADDGLVIIGVNVDRNTDDAARFLKKYPASFNILHNPTGSLAKAYGVQVMPSSVIIGRDGQEIAVHTGFKVKQQHEYEVTIRAALGLENKQ